MRVILSVSSYQNLTGSEIYTYELARELNRRGMFVTILANRIGGEIARKTPKGITLAQFFNHDGLPADLVINSQPKPTNYCITHFPSATHLQVIHSKLQWEEPVIAERIKHYVFVRPDVAEYWTNVYPLLEGKSSTIWNGVDTKRFNENYEKHHNKTFIRLFIGTIDYLRANVIRDLIREAIAEETKLWLVIPENPFGTELPENITVYPPTWKTEHYVKQCDETAGIFIGRTTIEGWMCGKPGLVYDVDDTGNITAKVTYGVPENRTLFNIEYMTDRLLDQYNKHRYEKTA